jgi:hypothetical protein
MWIVFCAAAIFLVAVLALFMTGIARIGMSAILFMLSVGLGKGINDYAHPDAPSSEKDREFAMTITMCPGLGHFYLGRNLIGAVALLLFAAGAAAVAYGFSLIGRTEDLDENNHAFAMFMYGVISIGAVAAWASISVNELCDGLGLPRKGSMYEMKQADAKKQMLILAALASLLLLPLSLGFIYWNIVGLPYGAAVIIATLAFLVWTIRSKTSEWRITDG